MEEPLDLIYQNFLNGEGPRIDYLTVAFNWKKAGGFRVRFTGDDRVEERTADSLNTLYVFGVVLYHLGFMLPRDYESNRLWKMSLDSAWMDWNPREGGPATWNIIFQPAGLSDIDLGIMSRSDDCIARIGTGVIRRRRDKYFRLTQAVRSLLRSGVRMYNGPLKDFNVLRLFAGEDLGIQGEPAPVNWEFLSDRMRGWIAEGDEPNRWTGRFPNFVR